MKKILGILLLLVLTLGGCTKEDAMPLNNNEEEQEQEDFKVVSLVGDEEVTIKQDEEYQDPGITVDGVLEDNLLVTDNLDVSEIGQYSYCYEFEGENYCRIIDVVASDYNKFKTVLDYTDEFTNYHEIVDVDISFSSDTITKTYYYDQVTEYTNLISKAQTHTNMLTDNDFTYTTYAKRFGDTFHFYQTTDDESFDFSQENMNEIYRFLLTDLELSDTQAIEVLSINQIDDDFVYEIQLSAAHIRNLYSEGFAFLAGFNGTVPNDAQVPATMRERDGVFIGLEIDLSDIFNEYFLPTFGVTIDQYLYRVDFRYFDEVEPPLLPEAIQE